MNLFNQLMTWPFWVGIAVGYVGRHLYCRLRARWLDRNRPLADHKPHERPKVNRSYIGGILAALVVVWSIYQIEVTSNSVRQLAAATKQCQIEFNSVLKARAQISDENDQLSELQRMLTGQWINHLLFPPPEIQHIRDTDPAFNSNPTYTTWGLNTTRDYFREYNKAQGRIDELQAERAAHPLPETKCGRE